MGGKPTRNQNTVSGARPEAVRVDAAPFPQDENPLEPDAKKNQRAEKSA
jgi:hypothetical protein